MSYEPESLGFNAGDEEDVRAVKVNVKERQRQLDAFLSASMDVRQGRAWIWGLLERTNMFRTSFSNRALEMAFAEGQRNVGLLLLADIMRVSPADYVKMMQENGEKND